MARTHYVFTKKNMWRLVDKSELQASFKVLRSCSPLLVAFVMFFEVFIMNLNFLIDLWCIWGHLLICCLIYFYRLKGSYLQYCHTFWIACVSMWKLSRCSMTVPEYLFVLACPFPSPCFSSFHVCRRGLRKYICLGWATSYESVLFVCTCICVYTPSWN